MSHQRVVVPAAGISFEGTRELFGLSSTEVKEAKELAGLALQRGSRPVGVTRRLVRRKSVARMKARTASTRRKKALAAPRRK